MNMDHELCDRALTKAGDEPMTESEWAGGENGARFRLLKGYYLATILEALSYVDWTMGKVRSKLEAASGTVWSNNGGTSYYKTSSCNAWDEVDMAGVELTEGATSGGVTEYTYTPENNTDKKYCYDLPADCARAISLSSGKEWISEGGRLYTDDDAAVLLYVTNGHLARAAVAAKAAAVTAGNYTQEDYPEYDMPAFENLFYQYIETRLASKIALKLTGKSELYSALYAEAYQIEQRAVTASRVVGVSRVEGERYWTEDMG